MPDIYDDDENVVTPSTLDRGAAQGFLSQYRERGRRARGQFEEIMAQRRAAIDEARAAIDQTIATMRERQAGGAGGINLPLLSLGSAMLAGPGAGGRQSTFGEDLARGLGAMGTTIRAQRMSDVDFERGVAELQRRKADLTDKPLADAQSLAGRDALAAETSAAALERALIKAGGEGATPAKIKEFHEWRKAPGNEGKTFQDFLKWRADELGADKTPAKLREFAEWKKTPGHENKSFAEFLQDTARVTAGGKETGRSQAEIAQSLPGIDANIEQMTASINSLLNHRGLEKSVGLTSLLPDIPGGPAADFNALLETLKGQAFLTQFDKLRGAGAITEAEGKKATDAIGALSTRQSPKQFREQLGVVLGILNKGREVARQKSGAGGIAAPTSREEFERLAPGTQFRAPDGSIRIKQ